MQRMRPGFGSLGCRTARGHGTQLPVTYSCSTTRSSRTLRQLQCVEMQTTILLKQLASVVSAAVNI
jgi:hypothetical protein